MTATVLADQAAIGAALSGMMIGAGIRTVPMEIVGGHQLSWGLEGAEQILPKPLLSLKSTPLETKSIPGYRESTQEGSTRPDHFLRDTDFFDRWRSLQGRINRVPSDEQFDFRLGPLQVAVWRQKAAGARGREVARDEYEEYARRLAGDGDFMSAFMVWELAMACPDPVSPDRYMAVQRESAAIALLNSIPDDITEYDPVSLRLARGLLYSFGISDPLLHGFGVSDRRVYNSMLLRASEYNEAMSRFFDAGAYRLRIVHSILEDASLDRRSWKTVSEMIDSAITLFEKSGSAAIDTVELLQLGVDAVGMSEVA